VREPVLLLLVAAALLGGCGRSRLDEAAVAGFVDASDSAMRARRAPEICELHAEDFVLTRRYLIVEPDRGMAEPEEATLGKRLFCRSLASFSRIRQYSRERAELEIDIAADGQTADVYARYVDTMPFYEEGALPNMLDAFTEMQIMEIEANSVVGLEDGEIRWLSSEQDIEATLVPKAEAPLPYD
jgi:hypothetical protein